MNPRLNRKPTLIPPVRARRQHLLPPRGQRPFGALLGDEAQRDEFVAYGVGRELRAAVRDAFEGGALRLAEDQELFFFLFGHSGLWLLYSIVVSGREPLPRFATPASWQASLPLP